MQTKHKPKVAIPDLNGISKFIPRPVKPERRGRPKMGHELMPKLDANRVAIAKLRMRHFNWSDINTVLNQWGIPCSAQSLSLWNRMKNKSKNKPQMTD